MEIINELKELNLLESEIKVYLATLKNGSSSVEKIAKTTNLIRTTTYGIIKSLINKGFMSKKIKSKIAYFRAIPPEKIIEILDNKKEKINSILPQLKEIQNSTPISEKRFEHFEGKEGLKFLLNEMISESNSNIKIVGTGGKFLTFSKKHMLSFNRKKKERNISIKAILADNFENRKINKQKLIENTNFKFLQKDYNYSGSLLISKKKITFVNFDKDSYDGYLIEDPELIKIMNIMFDNLWQNSKN